MRSIIELIDALDVRKRILIIGSAFVDVIVHVPRLPLSGEDVEGSSRQQVVGGCAYNAADAVAKLGIDFDALIPVGEGMGGDTDTIGCMAAAICGAHCGIGGIAAETVEFLEKTNGLHFGELAQGVMKTRAVFTL